MVPVRDGQAVSAGVTNPAFLDAQIDDIAHGKIGFANSDSASGTSVTNIQRETNALWSYLGGIINQVKTYLPTWANNNFGTTSDSLKARIEAIDAGAAGTGILTTRSGVVSVSASSTSKAITFSSAMPNTNYSINVVIENTTDATPIFLQYYVSARLTAGFTLTFSAPVDTNNYSVNYQVRNPI